ncbi:beta strand repeat-containing protein [Spirosoma harenae]
MRAISLFFILLSTISVHAQGQVGSRTTEAILYQQTGKRLLTDAQIAAFTAKGQSPTPVGNWNPATNVATFTPSNATATLGSSTTLANGSYLLTSTTVTAGVSSTVTGSAQTFFQNDWLIASNGVWIKASNPNAVTTASVGLINFASDAANRIFNSTPWDLINTNVSVSGSGLNGGTVSTANSQIVLPSGQTGTSTFLQKTITLSDYPTYKAGHTLKFTLIVNESTAGSFDTKLIAQLNVQRSGTQFSVASNVAYTRVTTTQVRATFDYTVLSGDTQLQPFLQVPTQSAQPASYTFTWGNTYIYDATNETEAGSVTDRFKTVNSGITTNANAITATNANLQVYDLLTVPTGGGALNGASINTTANTINIPVGQTGGSTFLQKPISLSTTSWAVGDTILFASNLYESVPGSSTNIITGLRINVTRSGSTTQNVGLSSSLKRFNSSQVTYFTRYIIQSGDTDITPLIQIFNSTTVASAYTFTWEPYVYNTNAKSAINPITKRFKDVVDGYTTLNNSTTGLIGDNKLYPSASYISTAGESLNGATSAGTSVTVPSGQTGQNAYRTFNYPISQFGDWADMVGVPTTFYFTLNTSSSLTSVRTLLMRINVNRSTSNVNAQGTGQVIKVLDANTALISITYTPTSVDTQLGIYLQFSDNTVAGSTQYFTVTNFYYNHAAPSGYPTSNSYTLSKALAKRDADIAALTQAVNAGPQVTTLTVSPDGTKQYLSVKLANDAITDASASKPYEILVYPGVYTDTEWIVKSYVTIRGTVRDQCWLKGENPDNATDATINGTSTLWLQGTASLINLRITMKNGRYPVHSEASGANVNAVHTIQNCYIQHLGNEDAKTWRNANPGSGMLASTVWSSMHAWGYGSASGVKETFDNVTFVSPFTGWYIHDREDFTKATINELRNCRIIRTGSFGNVLSIQPLGAGVTSSVTIDNSEISPGTISVSDNPWISQLAANQVANHGQIAVTIANSTPYLAYQDATRGTALRITSATNTGTSTVRFAGTAVTAVVGAEIDRDASGGLQGSAYGTWDISGILVGIGGNVAVNNTLGKRLGDCSSTPKSLSVTFDGATTKVISFSLNHTAQSNATILAYINSALGSSGTADEFNPSLGEFYPSFPERQRTLTNNTAIGIPRWSAVAYDASTNGVRIMTTSDPASSFMGIALHNISPGSTGRILTEGVLLRSQSQILGVSSTISQGASISISSTVNGQLEVSSSKPIGTARFAADVLYFKGN